MKYSNFRPTVSVYDDGRIGIDWGDSYEDTYDETSCEFTVDDAGPHSVLLDSLVVGVSTADGCRAIADHIDKTGTT